MSRAAKLLWAVVVLLLAILALVTVIAFQQRQNRKEDQAHFEQLTTQRNHDRTAQLQFLCGQINNLDNAITGLLIDARPTAGTIKAIAVLEAVECNPAQFTTDHTKGSTP